MRPRYEAMRTTGTTVLSVVVLLTAGTAFTVMSGGGIGMVNAQSTGISSCTTLNSSGEYHLTADIVTGVPGLCIDITTSNVTLDGEGHRIRGRENTPLQQANDGIHAAGTATNPLVNVSVRNVTTTGWSNGTRFNYVTKGSLTNATVQSADMNGVILNASTNNTLRNLVLRNNNEQNVEDLPGAGRGMTLTGNSRNNTVSNIKQINNKYSILLEGSSQDNRIRNVSSHNSTYVVYLYSTFDNHLRNFTSSGNNRWVLYSEKNSSGNTVTNLTMDTTTVSLEPKDVAIRPVPNTDIDAPPTLPNRTRGIGKYVQVTASRVANPGSVSFSMAYADSDVRSVNESSLALWRNTNGTWSRVNRSRQNTSDTRVSGTNLSFPPATQPGNRSVFALFATGNGSETGLRNTTPTPTTESGTQTPTITPARTQTPNATTTQAQTTTTTGSTEPTAGGSNRSTAASGTETSSSTGAGFGPVVTLVAVLVVALVGVRVAQ